jgi:hypothetical protein
MAQRHGEAGALWAVTRSGDALEAAYARAVLPPADKPTPSGPPQDQAGAIEPREQGDDFAAALVRMLLFGSGEHAEELPYAAAPPFARVRRGLPPVGLTMSAADDGWTIAIDALDVDETP